MAKSRDNIGYTYLIGIIVSSISIFLAKWLFIIETQTRFISNIIQTFGANYWYIFVIAFICMCLCAIGLEWFSVTDKHYGVQSTLEYLKTLKEKYKLESSIKADTSDFYSTKDDTIHVKQADSKSIIQYMISCHEIGHSVLAKTCFNQKTNKLLSIFLIVGVYLCFDYSLHSEMEKIYLPISLIFCTYLLRVIEEFLASYLSLTYTQDIAKQDGYLKGIFVLLLGFLTYILPIICIMLLAISLPTAPLRAKIIYGILITLYCLITYSLGKYLKEKYVINKDLNSQKKGIKEHE